MLSRYGGIALLGIVGVLLLFFVPTHFGPFSATRGPVTAFRSLVNARGLLAAISAALLLTSALKQVAHPRPARRTAGDFITDSEPLVLRC